MLSKEKYGQYWEYGGFLMSKNTENYFLDSILDKGNVVQIFLLGGIKLSGRIVESDEYTLTVETKQYKQLIYKHAITTISQFINNESDINDIYRNHSNTK